MSRIACRTGIAICRARRRRVFIKEQGVSEADGIDDPDSKVVHPLAFVGRRDADKTGCGPNHMGRVRADLRQVRNPVADGDAGHPRAKRLNMPDKIVAERQRQGQLQDGIEVPPDQHIGEHQARCLNPDADLARTRLRQRLVLDDADDVRPTERPQFHTFRRRSPSFPFCWQAPCESAMLTSST